MVKTKALEILINLIIENAQPVRIILFGSRATGEARKDSDYDIIVIKKGVENERVISSRIYRAMFRQKLKMPVDIIAVDEKKWEKLKNNEHLIYHIADKEGIVLYG